MQSPWWQRALDVVLPPRCVGCGRRGFEVCPQCLSALRPLGPALCPRCSVPSLGGRVCVRCARQEPILRATLARYPFEGVVRAAILALKYRSRTRLVPFLATALATALEARPLSVDVLVPVPLGPRRLRTRGFNQSELLANGLGVVAGLPIATEALIRRRETAQQTALPARRRRQNVANAFTVVDAEAIAGKRLLLVDDVCTTGATLEACASALQAGGGSGVWAVVVARELLGRPGSVAPSP